MARAQQIDETVIGCLLLSGCEPALPGGLARVRAEEVARRRAPEHVEVPDGVGEGRPQRVQPEERLALAHLNLTAARLAKGASAWNAAARHTRVARMLLPENAWEQHYDLAAPIHLLSVECEILDAQFDAAEQLADLTLQTLRTPIDLP